MKSELIHTLTSGYNVADHFVDANKMVELSSGDQREIDDVMFTRCAAKNLLSCIDI